MFPKRLSMIMPNFYWQVLERLKRSAEPEVVSEQEKAIEARVRAQYERAQRRLSELVCWTSAVAGIVRLN